METTKTDVLSERWGLPLEAVEGLGERLAAFHEQYRAYLRTQTRDTSAYGLAYISGLLRMESERNMANIGRMGAIAEQNMQQFMSDSPWSGPRLIVLTHALA